MADYVFVKSGGTASSGFATYAGAEDAWVDGDWADAECYPTLVAGMVPTIGQNNVTVVIDFASFSGAHTVASAITDNRWTGDGKVLRPRASSGNGTLQFGTTGLMFALNGATTGDQHFKRINFTRSGDQTDNWTLMRICQGQAAWDGTIFEDCVFGDFDWAGTGDLAEGLLFSFNQPAGNTNELKFLNCTFQNIVMNAAGNDSRNMLGEWIGAADAAASLKFEGCTFDTLTKTALGAAAGGNNREGFFTLRATNGVLTLDSNTYTSITSTGDSNGHSAFWNQETGSVVIDADNGTWSNVLFNSPAAAFGYQAENGTAHTFDTISFTDCTSLNSNEDLGTGGGILASATAEVTITDLTCTRVRANYGAAVYCTAGGEATINGLSAIDCSVIGGVVYFGGHGSGSVQNFKIVDTVQLANTLAHPGMGIYAHNSPTSNENSNLLISLGRIVGGTPNGATTNTGIYINNNDTVNLNTMDVLIDRIKVNTAGASEIELVTIANAGDLTVDMQDVYLSGGSAAISTSQGTSTTLTLTETRTKDTNRARASLGLLGEKATVKSALWPRDFTNAAWVKTNITAAKDATGIDGVANSASTLTATAGNGTALQTVTLVNAEYTSAVYVRRKTGTGNIDITDDNGGTWTTLTALNTSHWTRYPITRTQANPVIGFRLVVDTDEIEVDFFDIEPGGIPTTDIAHTSGVGTRDVDRCSTSDISWISEATGTWYASGRQDYADGDTYLFEAGNTLSNANRTFMRLDSTNPLFSIVDGNVTQANIDAGTYVTGADFKMAGAYAVNDVVVSFDGAAVVADTSATMPAVADMDIFWALGGTQTNRSTAVTVAEIAHWTPRKTNSQVEGLAT